MGVKTVHITNSYHSTSGGIRTFYHALIDAANREQRYVRLIVPGPRNGMQDVGPFGRIYTLRAGLAPAFDRRYRTILPHTYFPDVRGGIVDILEREQPDLLEICDKYTLPYLAAMLRKQWHPRVPRPVLVGLTCERFDDNMAAYCSRSRAARAFTRWYIRHIYGPPFDAHIAVSDYTASELRTALPDRPSGFIRVGPMGVDTGYFGPDRRNEHLRFDLLRRAGGTKRSTLLLYAGRLSPEKNLGLLIDALKILVGEGADYRLILAGDGPSADWIRRQARGPIEGRILLCGSLDRSALASMYASADVFVHPNPREPFGIGPLEAMASGVPVVAPASGGVLEYATERNSWLAPASAASFAAAIRSARLGDRERVVHARQTAARFGWEGATRRYFALYDEIRAAYFAAVHHLVPIRHRHRGLPGDANVGY